MHPTTKDLRALRRIIGQAIRTARTKKKMTLHKLSRLTGIPEGLLDQYELGKNAIGLEEIVRINHELLDDS